METLKELSNRELMEKLLFCEDEKESVQLHAEIERRKKLNLI